MPRTGRLIDNRGERLIERRQGHRSAKWLPPPVGRPNSHLALFPRLVDRMIRLDGKLYDLVDRRYVQLTLLAVNLPFRNECRRNEKIGDVFLGDRDFDDPRLIRQIDEPVAIEVIEHQQPRVWMRRVDEQPRDIADLV